MTHVVVRTTDEINHQINLALDAEAEGISAYPGMTYEQGVKDGLEWVFGEIDEQPIPD